MGSIMPGGHDKPGRYGTRVRCLLLCGGTPLTPPIDSA
jgi:hypothetical protein